MFTNYIGIDYHKHYSQITIINASGEIKKAVRIKNEPEELRRFFRAIEGRKEAVMEACRGWSILYDILEGEVDRLILAHPLKVKAIASAKIKNDKIDSKILAYLLKCDLIPEAYIPSKETRLKKNILRQRMFFIRLQTMIKNRIWEILDRNHISHETLGLFKDIFGRKGLEYLRSLRLSSETENSLFKVHLDFLAEIRQKICLTDALIEEIAGGDKRISWLMSIPGIGKFFSVLLLYEIDDITRFASPGKLCSYAGIIPSLYASGDKSYSGRITKTGNRYLRWALIEAVNPAVRSSLSIKFYYERIKSRKNSNIARVAVARKLLELVWHILKKERYYEERYSHTNKVNTKVA